MRRFFGVVGGVTLLVLARAVFAQVVPTLPPTDAVPFAGGFWSGYAPTTTVTANATACTVPGGASCTVILASTRVSEWPNLTVYVIPVTGTLDNVLVEVSSDGSTGWTDISAGKANGASTQQTINWLGHYRYVRVESRSAAGATAKVGISGFRP